MEEKYNRGYLLIHPSRNNFIGSDDAEPMVCSLFGCHNKLTIQERLFSDRCISHNGKKEKIISIKKIPC